MENLIGFILPPVIDLINARISDSRVKYIVSLLVCLVVAGIINFQQLSVGNVDEFLSSAGIIFAGAQTIYKLYWEKSQARVSYLERVS